MRLRLKKAGVDDLGDGVIDDIEEGIERIDSIIDELQEFSHRGAPGGRRFFLHEAVQSALKILAEPIKNSGVSIEQDNDPEVALVANKNQLTQVISNLVLNAIQALEGVNKPLIRISVSEDRPDWVRCSVSDNGSGIPPKELRRLFDPFYTTKDPGIGTGLGLSVCLRIVNAHGGQIQVDSEEGKGTVFRVLLPVLNKDV